MKTSVSHTTVSGVGNESLHMLRMFAVISSRETLSAHTNTYAIIHTLVSGKPRYFLVHRTYSAERTQIQHIDTSVFMSSGH